MARPRSQVEDPTLTMVLDIEDVIAIHHPDSDDDNFYAILDDWEIPVCVKCGKKMRNQDLKKKVFLDVITNDDGIHHFIKLHYFYHRYRCTEPGCQNVYSKPVLFADQRSHVTHRFENYIVQLAMTYSYHKIEIMVAKNVSDDWDESYTDVPLQRGESKITAQNIGAIIKKWVARKDEERIFNTPEVLGLRTCDARLYNYVIAYDATHMPQGEEDVYIIDVLDSASTPALMLLFSHLDKSKIKYVVTDFNETLVNGIRTELPNTTVLIGPQTVLESTLVEFDFFLRHDMKQLSKELKDAMLGDPGLISATTDNDLQRVFAKYETLENAYRFVERLWNQIFFEHTADELQELNTEMAVVCHDQFGFTSAAVEHYWNEIYNFYMRRHVVNEESYEQLKELDSLMRTYSNFSTDILRARILYLGASRGEPTEWRGVKCSEVIEKIRQSPDEQRRIRYALY